MSTFPSDLEVERHLMLVRERVMDATKHVRSSKHSTRYRTTRNLIIAGVAIAALTAGAIAVVQASQSTRASEFVCYPGLDLDADTYTVYADPAQYPDGQPDPIEMCSYVWQKDLFNPANNELDPNVLPDQPVPPLVACTLPDGHAGVFPRDDSTASDEDFCGALGLADWDSD